MNILRHLHSRASHGAHDIDPPALFETASRTHAGSRELNEDRLLERSDLGLWAVADGMGGHACGDVAAQCVIDALSAAEPRSTDEAIAAVGLANESLYARSSHANISGSTVVILRIDGDKFDCLWAGDSELWLASNGELRKISRDHSVVEDLVRSGLIDESQRRSHPQAHLITRAVGATEAIELEKASGTTLVGDVFLLCSDGLTNVVSPEALSEHLSGGPLEEIATRLLASALECGAPDNVTLLLVRVEGHEQRTTAQMRSTAAQGTTGKPTCDEKP